jgi:hypothetical protein
MITNIRHTRKSALIPALLFASFANMIFPSCSQNPDRSRQGMIEVSFNHVDEPLFDNVNNARFLIRNAEMTTLLDTVLEPGSFFDDGSLFRVDPGSSENLVFNAFFYDQAQRPLYRVYEFVYIFELIPENIILHPRQTGFRSGTVVKVLRDIPPWDSYGLDTTLTGIGLTAGTANGQYTIYSSSDLPSISLIPGIDILIISNDQPQAFYNSLSMNLYGITKFVHDGGTVFWETCDMAWNYGSYADAGLDTFPGGVTQTTMYDTLNTVFDSDYSLTGVMGNTLIGDYASNKRYANLPDSAIVYTLNSVSDPTLIALKFGNGVIFYSGQPLEYNFDRRDNYNIGFLLPRISGFLLGTPWVEP